MGAAAGVSALKDGFEGQKAPDDIWHLYVGADGKRIVSDELKHNQNPIRYSGF
jgi:hypothetical protein